MSVDSPFQRATNLRLMNLGQLEFSVVQRIWTVVSYAPFFWGSLTIDVQLVCFPFELNCNSLKFFLLREILKYYQDNRFS